MFLLSLQLFRCYVLVFRTDAKGSVANKRGVILMAGISRLLSLVLQNETTTNKKNGVGTFTA
jgi:hypothetical protein